MKSDKYLETRAIKDLISSINETEDYINNTLESIYKEALKDISEDLENIYKSFSIENILTLEEAKRKISKAELRLNGFKDISEDTKNLITKLELIQLQIDARLKKLYEDEEIYLYEHLYKTYENNYYKTIYELSKEIGFNLNFNLLNDKAIQKVITSNWIGINFSERISKRKDKTFKTIKDAIEKGVKHGSGVDKIVRDIRKRVEVSKSHAKSIVRTETNYAFNKGTLDGYKASGLVNEYRFLATLDHRTSDLCISLDGKVFKLKEASFGVNYPPMHVNCRSTTVAHFNDYNLKTRRYNLGNGEKGTINYTTYKQWVNSLPIDKKKELEISKKKWVNNSSDKEQYNTYKNILGRKEVGSFDSFQDLKYRNLYEYKALVSKYRRQSRLRQKQ